MLKWFSKTWNGWIGGIVFVILIIIILHLFGFSVFENDNYRPKSQHDVQDQKEHDDRWVPGWD